MLVLVLIALPVAAGLLLGALVAFVLQPSYDRMRHWGLGPVAAAASCAIGSVTFIGAVILSVGYLLVSRGLVLLQGLPDAVAPRGVLHPVARQLASVIGALHLASGDPLSLVMERVGLLAYHTTGLALSAGKGAAFILMTLLFLGLAAHYVLLYWPAIVARAEHDLPFAPVHTRALFAEFRNVGRQIFFGTVSAGLLQGLLATIGCWLTGVPEALFLGALTAVVSLLPGVGGGVVWVPAGLFLIYTGHPLAGVLELLYGALVVSVGIELVIRPRLVGVAQLPKVFTFVGLFGGVALFGLMGLILGPVIVSLCVAVLKIYNEEVVEQPVDTTVLVHDRSPVRR